ncbi:MAG: pyruvate, phosphate dikinase [Aeromicrobium sp.]|nr:pyruvate, phosphate dikinase [Aeromicrobium sp.]
MTQIPATLASVPDVVRLDGTSELGKEALGGKAWGINSMRSLGLPVPPAVVATTRCCHEYYEADRRLGDQMWDDLVEGVRWLEAETGRTFGSTTHPLLVSVRSGAAISMPGMMDTVLNLGINDEVEAALAAETGDPAYAADTRRRFLAQYTSIVLGGSGEVPDDPWVQLRAAVAAVFDSWASPRAQAYRKNRKLTEDAGTAVTVQAMVFGNLDDRSGTGVLFTRNPITGEKPIFGEWLSRGQGEDVVSGSHDPLPLDALGETMPEVHAELLDYSHRLEQLRRDIQDIEFTIESGRLWVLQYRTAKRYARAAVRAAVEMAAEGLITSDEAVRRVTADQVRQLLKPELDHPDGEPLFTGEPACPGFASGIVVTDPDEAEDRGDDEDVILARDTTSPDDLHGMLSARAIVTELGGSTSHAAVVSRELHRPCIVGVGVGTVTSLAGQVVTIDGERGEIWAGALELRPVLEDAIADFGQLHAWATPLVPLTVLRESHGIPDDTVDLDAADDWRTALQGARSVRGSVLDSDDGIKAVLEAGVAEVVVPYALPVLITALAHVDAPR